MPPRDNDEPLTLSRADDRCPECTTHLKHKIGRESPFRLVEEIAPPAQNTIIFEEIKEGMWCNRREKYQAEVSQRSVSERMRVYSLLQ